MTPDAWTQLELGKPRDLIVVVDDWKGARAGDPESPVAFVGRVFRREPAFESLADALRVADARRWHAGKRGRSLFRGAHFDHIFSLIEETNSTLLTQLWIRDQYHRPEVVQFVDSLSPRVRSAWSPLTPHAVGLLEYCMRTRWYLGNVEAAPPHDGRLRVLVISDTQDWLSRGGARKEQILHTITPLPVSANPHVMWVDLEVVSITDKERAPDAILDFLGLVDSEAWIFGREASTKLSNDTTVHERFVAWQQTGRPHNLRLDDLERMMNSAGPAGRRYLEVAHGWPLRLRQVSLTTAEDPDVLFHSMARELIRQLYPGKPLSDEEAASTYARFVEHVREQAPRPVTHGSWLD